MKIWPVLATYTSNDSNKFVRMGQNPRRSNFQTTVYQLDNSDNKIHTHGNKNTAFGDIAAFGGSS